MAALRLKVPAGIFGSNGILGDQHMSGFTWPAANVPAARLDAFGVDAIGVETDGTTAAIDATTTFTDAGTVQGGKTYYWVVTAVSSSNVESVVSGEVSATIPTP